MSFRVVCLIGFIGVSVGSLALADDSTEREKLTGSWQSQDGSGAAAKAVWILESQGDVVHITNSQGDKKIAEYACNLGKECEVKDGGRKVKVTLYFNGPKLVVIETKGDEVVKRRFGAADQGDILELEVIPVAPAGKTETLHFQRVKNAENKPH
jgi:hypothetical protein